MKDIELIIQLIELYHAAPEAKEAEHVEYTFDKKGISQILNQTIRQLWIPKDHYKISVKAWNLWNKIAEGDIRDYFYHDRVKVKCDSVLPYYKGNANEPAEKEWLYPKGKTFSYRSVFHDEHIVPVETIEKKLLEFENPTSEEVKDILSKIYVCKMLKEEDRKITKKSNRGSDNYLEIIKACYQNIKICGMEK